MCACPYILSGPSDTAHPTKSVFSSDLEAEDVSARGLGLLDAKVADPEEE